MLTQLIGAICKPWRGDNRRRWRRRRRVTYIELQPIDEDLILQGHTVWGMTRNISNYGIGLTTSFKLDCKYVIVNIREDNFTSYGVIRHQTNIAAHCENPLYFVGIELVDESVIVERN